MFPTTAEGTSATSETGTKSLNGSYEACRTGTDDDEGAVDGHQQGVAVGCGLSDCLGADDGVRSRPVVDDELLAQVFAHLLSDEPAEEVRGAARCEWGHQRDLRRG